MKKKLLVGMVVVFCLALAAAAFAGEREDGQAKPEPQMRKEMVKLKYVHARDAVQLLNAYTSRGGRISMSMDANRTDILVLNDTPEIVEKMLSLIKEIDIKPAELQFTVQIVLGSEAGDDKFVADEALKNDPVIRELRGVLKYKNFSQLDGTVMRTLESENAQVVLGKNGEYEITLSPKYIRDDKADSIQVQIRLRKIDISGNIPSKPSLDLISTSLMLKPGEKTVVGVSRSDADKGLILIISGKVMK